MITLEGVVCSFRINKMAEDGGGIRFTVDLDESQLDAWASLARWHGKNVKLTAELSEHQ